MKKKIRLRFRAYFIISEAVEQGVRYGYARAYKHTATPKPEKVMEEIMDAVLLQLGEAINFDD